MGAVDIEGTPEVLTKLAIQVTTDMGDIDVSERLNGKVMENETDNLQTFEQKVEKATGSLTIETIPEISQWIVIDVDYEHAGLCLKERLRNKKCLMFKRQVDK